MTTFTWVPEFGSQKQVKPSIDRIKFGDGYEQRVASGLNLISETWNLSFANRDSSEATSLLGFLEGRMAVEAFTWTPPDAASAKVFVCRSWNVIPERGGRFTITAQFEQVYEP